jgi:hypothetical protein
MCFFVSFARIIASAGWYNFAQHEGFERSHPGPNRAGRTAPPRAHDWAGLTADDLLRRNRTMLLSRRIDDKEIQLKNQS